MLFLREIVGHRQVINILLNAIAYGRVSHAYLFSGPEGVGKETAAFAFARALLCSRPGSGDACGECRECRQAENRNHPDLQWVQPAGASIKIEQIRSVQRKTAYLPYQGNRQIFIICQAETMTEQAANCLLKTLEEPSGNTIFILVSSRPQALLPTILSRCQQVSFHAVPVSELAHGLVSLHGLKAEDALLSAALSGGSMGRALLYSAGSFQDERGAAYALIKELAEAGPCRALEMAEKCAESREKARFMLEMLTCWYRDLLVSREAGSNGFLYNQDRAANLERDAECFETSRLVEIIENIEATKNKIEASANTRLALEALFLYLSGGPAGPGQSTAY